MFQYGMRGNGDWAVCAFWVDDETGVGSLEELARVADMFRRKYGINSGRGGFTMDFRHEGDTKFRCAYRLDFSAIIHRRLTGAIPPPASADRHNSTRPRSSPHERTLPYYS